MFRLGQRALELNAEWFEGHYNLANLLADMGPELENAALRAYERALSIDPDDANAHNNFSLVLQRAGRLRDSLTHAREATRLAPQDGTVWRNLAAMLLLEGEMDEALACAKKAVALAPQSHAAHACLAAMYELSDAPAEAVPCYTACLALAAGDPAPAPTRVDYVLRAYTLLHRLGRHGDARSCVADHLGDEVLAGLVDARDGVAGGYTAAARGLDKGVALVLAGQTAAAKEWLARHADPDTTSVSQICFATMAGVALPGHEALTHKCRLAENLQKAGADHWAPESFVVRYATCLSHHCAVDHWARWSPRR
jgi:tetratricopeptide (TPR) repeat protein